MIKFQVQKKMFVEQNTGPVGRNSIGHSIMETLFAKLIDEC